MSSFRTVRGRPGRGRPALRVPCATLNPITDGVDAARSLAPALSILIVVDLVLGAIAVRYLNRASSSSAR